MLKRTLLALAALVAVASPVALGRQHVYDVV
jgi:hypothetical protein